MGLNHVRTGEGEPLILLHGIGSELCMWEPVMDALGEHRDVIAVDMPGFGESPALPDHIDPTPQNLARAIGGLVRQLGFERVHVCGNSLGGWVALEMGRLGLATTVTCLSPAGLWAPPARVGPTRGTARRWASALRPLLPALMLSKRARHLALGMFVGHPERVPRKAATRMVSSYGRATAYEATSYAMRSSHLVDAHEIDVPITIGWAERDRMLRPARLHAPDVVAVTLPDCGHLPTWDAPELVTRLILQGSERAAIMRPRGGVSVL